MFSEQGDTASGPGVEYFRELLQRMGQDEATFRSYPLSRLLFAINAGDIDIALFLMKTPEREKNLHFPESPFHATYAGIAVRANTPITSITSPADLLGLRIGVWQDSYVSPFLKHPELQILTIAGNNAVQRNLLRLQAKRINAVYNPDIAVLRFRARKLGLSEQIRLLPLPGPPVPIYPVFSDSCAPELIPRYEAVVRSGTVPDYAVYLETFLEHLNLDGAQRSAPP